MSSGPSFARIFSRVKRGRIAVMVQVLHHARADQQGIGDRPGTRRVLHQAEFERKPVAMRFEKRIDSARVSVKISSFARGDVFLRRLGGDVEARESAASRSILTVASPMISESSPAAARRIMSICHRRSCAVT